jgi:hypothetical protein
MRGGTGIAAFLLSILLFTSSALADRIEPVYNPVNLPIPGEAQKLSADQIGRNIIIAGTKRHWQIERQSPGNLKGVYDDGKRMATIAITYTNTSYNITLVTSRGMDQEGDKIHHNYNRWIHYLQEDIAVQLTAAAAT